MKSVFRNNFIYINILIILLITGCGTETTPTYQLTTSVVGNGTVSPSSGQFDEGESVTITSTPDSGWVFSNWEGDLKSSETPTSVTMNRNLHIIANFEENTFFLNNNGVTVMCPESNVGDKGIINGVEYESVDNELLLKRRDEGADLSKVCTSHVNSLINFFQNTTIQPQLNTWDVSNVTHMGFLFSYSEFNQDISSWNVSSVINMGGMFSNSMFNQDLSNWDVSNVTDMGAMFNTSPFNQPIGNWDVSNVTNMGSTFQSSKFNQDISNWDVSNVKLMLYMFSESSFNQPLGTWNVSNVTDMNFMFSSSQFNHDISNWCVSQIPSEPTGFSTNAPLTEENKPKWGTCPSN